MDGGDYLADCGFEGGTPGQATRIAGATGGAALIGVPPEEVANTILGLITTLQVAVTPTVTCSDPGITVTFDPSSRTVAPGATTTFTETIGVAAGTPGGTYTCAAKFLIDGADAGAAFTQAIEVTVPTVTVPADRVLLFIDEDSIDNGKQPNGFAARAVNDHIAKVGLRTPLPAFDGANIGALYTLHTGDVGDEAWFAPPRTIR